ncbi:hypothetical protein [Specibacter cremeus]|uniref:hypothetical protein n=1 Tax=Specibacter cremeus TaxID=1629051 RepID=UPI000F7AAAD6|nr:hypothetical protein [Specibacter cremeus]
MKFVLEIELDGAAVGAAPAAELGRILRCRVGNLKYHDLIDGTSETIMDNTYSPVGTWRVTAAND